MKKLSLIAAALALCACSNDAPPPKPAPKAAPAPAAQPAAPKPEAKAPAPAPVAAPKPDPNRELASRVKHALEDEAKIHAAGIDVTANNGHVTLWGTAGSESERKRAGQVAAKVGGVTGVENNLKVVRGS
jgi:hypothetical protein